MIQQKPLPLTLALCLLGWASGIQAADYIVPPGATKLQVTLAGAGGGAGGADLGGAAGVGANGAQMVVEFDVQPGQTVTYEVGTGGTSGESWDISGKAGAGMQGGAGGNGQGAGGAGGAAPLANFNTSEGWSQTNPDPESGSGGGGGGGGATSATVNGQWARAGGGGGGGGGSWNRAASPLFAAGIAPVETADCSNAGTGITGEAGTGTRTGNPNRGGGGGGGSGGGYLTTPTATPAPAGWDGAGAASDGAHGGAPGASCYSPGVRLLSNDLTGGGAGSTSAPGTSDGTTVPPVAPAGADGSFAATPIIEPITPMATPGDQSATLEVTTLPPSIQASDVVSYAFTCTPDMGSQTNPITTTTLPLTVNGLTNDQTYTCTVIANLIDPNTQDPYSTPVGQSTTVTPKAAPVVIPPASTAPVPTLGTWSALSLSAVVAVLGLQRTRRKASRSQPPV